VEPNGYPFEVSLDFSDGGWHSMLQGRCATRQQGLAVTDFAQHRLHSNLQPVNIFIFLALSVPMP
jgi:hypothetical protein